MAETAEQTAEREAAEAAAQEKAEAERKAAEEAAAESGKTLTQAEVDAIVEQRLARERKKFADYNELKEKASKFEEQEAAKLSELEKERKAREDAEAKAKELAAERDDMRIRAALISEATKQGAKSTDAVLRAVDKTGLTIGDDGQVSGAEEAVKALLAEIPALVGKTTPEGADQGARGGSADQIGEAQLASMSPEEIKKALDEGRLTNLLG